MLDGLSVRPSSKCQVVSSDHLGAPLGLCTHPACWCPACRPPHDSHPAWHQMAPGGRQPRRTHQHPGCPWQTQQHRSRPNLWAHDTNSMTVLQYHKRHLTIQQISTCDAELMHDGCGRCAALQRYGFAIGRRGLAWANMQKTKRDGMGCRHSALDCGSLLRHYLAGREHDLFL